MTVYHEIIFGFSNYMESESNSLNSHTTDQHDLTMAKDIPDIKIKS